MYKSYKYLRPLSIFAGIIGILQALTWIAMAITGIVAYTCGMNFSLMEATMGSVTELTFFHMYFHGMCEQPGLPVVDFTPLAELNLMTPIDVHAWMWVYLIISFFWLISSITLITNVTTRFLRWCIIFIGIWIFLTISLSFIDLGLGIVFGIDYETLMLAAHQIPIVIPLEQTYFVLMSGQAAAGIMMAVCFRGYLLWVINVALCIYLFIETFKIHEYNKLKRGITNPAYGNPHPIDAYGSKQNPNLWYTPSANNANMQPAVQRTENGLPPGRTLSANSLYDERKRHYDAQQRRHDSDVQLRRDDAAASVVRELNHRNSYNANSNGRPYRNEPGVPAPDYSPPMPRSNNPYDNRGQLRSALRSSRYQ